MLKRTAAAVLMLVTIGLTGCLHNKLPDPSCRVATRSSTSVVEIEGKLYDGSCVENRTWKEAK